MSFRKMKAEAQALTKRVNELEFASDRYLKIIESLIMRIEALEQRKKPGPKPKSQRDSSQPSKVSTSPGNGALKPEDSAIQ